MAQLTATDIFELPRLPQSPCFADEPTTSCGDSFVNGFCFATSDNRPCLDMDYICPDCYGASNFNDCLVCNVFSEWLAAACTLLL